MAGSFGKRNAVGAQSGGSGAAQVAAASGGGLVPPTLQSRLRLGAQIAAAGLLGFGLILWIAAHWDEISRFQRFALVGGALAVSILVSLINAARVPGLLLAFLATGGLFALIGQTYQTGADPWQLFAVWAAVGLPWAIAARSDALWLVWAVVAHVAVALWMATFAHASWFTLDVSATLMGWGMALAVTGLLSPWMPAKAWIGDSKWAFRLSMLITIGLITQAGVTSLFFARDVAIVYWLALLLLGGMAAALLTLPRLDLVLVAVMGLAIDTMLITGFARTMFSGMRGDATLSFLLVGLVGSGIVAGTGALILRLIRERGEANFDMETLKGREWPLILMTGFGALLATLPLSAFLGLFIGPFLTIGIGPYLIGAIFLAGAVWFLRSTPQTSFSHQMATIALTLGYCLIAYGLTRDARGPSAAVAFVLTLLAGGLAIAVGRSWSAGLLGGAAASTTALFVNTAVFSYFTKLNYPNLFMARGWMIVLLLATGWYVAVALTTRKGETESSLPFADSIERFMGGFVAIGLIGVMATAGPTFLLSGAIGGIGPSRHLVTGIELSMSSISIFSALLALAGCAWLLAPRPNLQTTLGFGASLIVIVLSSVIPSLGITVLLLCVAMTTGRRAVGVGAFIAALWVIGAFYYWLGWPLAEKAALMTAAGIMLGALCWLTGMRRPEVGLGSGTPAPALLARGLVLAGALATGGLAAQSITTNEAIIANGRQIFLALAPVDPRSLIQGDFMRLNFAVPNQPRRNNNGASILGERRWAIATIDERRVATIQRVVDTEPTPAAGELVLPMRFKDRRWIVGTDAWFFREGTAKKWEEARFGVLRVGSNGTALLVDMADKDLSIIK